MSQTETQMHKLTRTVAKTALAPLIAAATTYAARRVPQLLEDKVLPKLREAGGPRAIAGEVASKAGSSIETAKTAVGDLKAPSLVHDAAQAVKSVVPGSSGSESAPAPPSAEERERARKERESRRSARRTSTSTSGKGSHGSGNAAS